ncbi:MAG: hypothetical protein ABIN25_11340 [Ginsengibacter sp.]
MIRFQLLLFTSCKKDEYTFGKLQAPTALALTAAVSGMDAVIQLVMAQAMLIFQLPRWMRFPTRLILATNGIINFGTGGTMYEISSITPTTIHLRNKGIDGNAWYQKLKMKP